MKIFVDENIPLMTIDALQKKRNDVVDIRGSDKEGLSDENIWKLARESERLLITTDKGFTQYRNESHYGILIVRLRKPNRKRIHNRIMKTIDNFSPQEWPGLLVVIRDNVQSVWKSKQ